MILTHFEKLLRHSEYDIEDDLMRMKVRVSDNGSVYVQRLEKLTRGRPSHLWSKVYVSGEPEAENMKELLSSLKEKRDIESGVIHGASGDYPQSRRL